MLKSRKICPSGRDLKIFLDPEDAEGGRRILANIISYAIKKTMNRFFVPAQSIKGDIALIPQDQAHHILDVLRLKKEDPIEIFDGSGKLYQGKIIETAERTVKVKIERTKQDLPHTQIEITLVQALPKKHKMDEIVEKATELGVAVIIPLQTVRTIVRLDKAKQLEPRQRRWQKITGEAAQQCGRTTIPQIKSLVSWQEIFSILDNFDLKLLACLSANRQSLKDILRAQHQARKIVLLIGPEGDFTPAEVRQAKDKGFLAISLGETVLKTDTAAIAALAMINYELK